MQQQSNFAVDSESEFRDLLLSEEGMTASIQIQRNYFPLLGVDIFRGSIHKPVINVKCFYFYAFI